MILELVKDCHFDATCSSLASFGINDFTVSTIIIFTVIYSFTRCMVDVAIMRLEYIGAFVYKILQYQCPWSVFPRRLPTLDIFPEDQHLSRLVVCTHPDVLILWQLIIQKYLLYNERDRSLHTLLNAPVKEFGIILDLADIFLAKWQKLNCEILNCNVVDIVMYISDGIIAYYRCIMTINDVCVGVIIDCGRRVICMRLLVSI